ALLLGQGRGGRIGAQPAVDPGRVLAGRALGQLEEATRERLLGLDEASQAEAEVEVGGGLGRGGRFVEAEAGDRGHRRGVFHVRLAWTRSDGSSFSQRQEGRGRSARQRVWAGRAAGDHGGGGQLADRVLDQG